VSAKKESPLLRQARKEAKERALLTRSCECEIDSHDHGSSPCPRILKIRYYCHWVPGSPHLPDANNIMVVCSSCHSQILSARRRIY
jgi:hypothetical protein